MSDQATTQSKYKKKKKPEQQPSIDPNEVRIKGNQGHVKRYVDYACSLLEGKRIDRKRAPKPTPKEDDSAPKEDASGAPKTEETAAEKPSGDDTKSDEKEEAKAEPLIFDTIVLKATGRAINKAVTTAEVVKRRISGLHQVTSLETLEITDVWEPLEQGLKEVETRRRVASITITLSRDEGQISKDAAGYQQPISSDAIKPFTMQTNNRRRGGGYRQGGGYNRDGNRRNRGGYNRNRGYNNRGGYNRRGGNRNRGGYGGGGYGGGGGYNNRSPNRSPRGGYGGGGGGGGRGRGRGGYNRNRGGYGGGYQRNNRY